MPRLIWSIDPATPERRFFFRRIPCDRWYTRGTLGQGSGTGYGLVRGGCRWGDGAADGARVEVGIKCKSSNRRASLDLEVQGHDELRAADTFAVRSRDRLIAIVRFVRFMI